MKLYFHPGSSNARKPRITAALLNIDLELALVDVFTGGHKKPEYLSVNPNGMLPALDDGGFVLWESNAISQYLASKKSSPDLFPSDAKTRADVARWQFWDVAHWTPAVQTIVFERVFKKFAKMGEPNAAAVEKATKDFHRFATVLNGVLEGKDFLVTNHITLADVSLAAQLTHAAAGGVPVGEYKHLQRWFSSIEKLDAWKKTAPPALG